MLEMGWDTLLEYSRLVGSSLPDFLLHPLTPDPTPNLGFDNSLHECFWFGGTAFFFPVRILLLDLFSLYSALDTPLASALPRYRMGSVAG